ncbi:MAG TPA: A24 family peptidase [Acetobacteraceae bacterium]|nr:A24 family peptidase [Acetobacteraceae bacterium]
MILASAAIVLLAAWHDLVSRTVPNWMPALIAGFGIVAALVSARLLISTGLGLAIFVAAAICWRRGLMGGADVKLLGAIAIALPPGMVSLFVVAMSLAGAVHAVAYLVARRMVTRPPALVGAPAIPPRARSLLPRALRAERWRISRGGPLPYACAIAFGFLFVVCNGAAP